MASRHAGHRRSTLLAVLLVLTATLVGAAPSSAIVGGQFDADAHPYAGAVDTPGTRSGGYASGVLISPTVFLTAGHVTRNAFENNGTTRAAVTFDAIANESSTYYIGTVHTNPAYDPQRADGSGDLGVIVFEEPIPGIEPASLPTADLLDHMGSQELRNETFPVVGYGISRIDGGSNGGGGGGGGGGPSPDLTSAGTRNAAEQSFISLTAEWLRLQTRDDARVCRGDSGSPNLLGRSNTVVAITVGSLGNCNTTNWAVRLDTPSTREFLRLYVALP